MVRARLDVFGVIVLAAVVGLAGGIIEHSGIFAGGRVHRLGRALDLHLKAGLRGCGPDPSTSGVYCIPVPFRSPSPCGAKSRGIR